LVLVFRGRSARQVKAKTLAHAPDEEQNRACVTEEVRLPVAATDAYGHYDPALDIADVLVLEDGSRAIRSISTCRQTCCYSSIPATSGLKNTNLTRMWHADHFTLHWHRIAVMQFRPSRTAAKVDYGQNAIAKVLKRSSSSKSSRRRMPSPRERIV